MTAASDDSLVRRGLALACFIVIGDLVDIAIVSHDPRLKDIALRVITIENRKLVHEEKSNHDHNC